MKSKLTYSSEPRGDRFAGERRVGKHDLGGAIAAVPVHGGHIGEDSRDVAGELSFGVGACRA